MNDVQTGSRIECLEPAGVYGRPAYRAYVLVLILAVAMMSFMDRTLVGILAPLVKADLKLSDSELGLVNGTAFAFIYACFTLPFGWLADRRSRTMIISGSLAAWSIFTGLFGLVVTLPQMLAARAGAGLAEAGGAAPSHSLLIDAFPFDQRSRALAVYGVGIPLGVAAGGLVGGPVSAVFGWRATFMMAGALGVLLALVIKLTVVEPQRVVRAGEASKPEPFFRSLWIMLAKPGFMFMCGAITCGSIVGLSRFLWIPSFFVRSFAISYVEVAIIFGIIQLIAGIGGSWIGGVIADRLSRRNDHAPVYLSAWAYLGAAPFLIGMVLTSSSMWAWICYFAMTFIEATASGPLIVGTQYFATARLRGIASAIMIFCSIVFAMGIGIPMIGLASDLLAPAFKNESLRYALMGLPPFYLLGATFLFLAARQMRPNVNR